MTAMTINDKSAVFRVKKDTPVSCRPSFTVTKNYIDKITGKNVHSEQRMSMCVCLCVCERERERERERGRERERERERKRETHSNAL